MRRKLIICFLVLLAISEGCVERYQLPVDITANKYLVVKSFLDPITNTCDVSLHWTQQLSEKGAPLAETGATIQLEDDNSNFSSIAEVKIGEYSASNLSIDAGRKYRVNITLTSGSKYQSDWVQPLVTPPIDSITWDEHFDHLRLKVNTHDPANKTRYYSWTFDETWEYTAAFHSLFEFQNGSIVSRSEDVYTCWKTESSNEILSASSVQLQNDVITNFVVKQIEKNSQRLYIRYSINVKQTSLSREAYDYLDALKKNSQNLGTPYDPLPSQVTGNYKNLNGSNPVIGYFFSSSVQEKRIFIGLRDLPLDFWSTPDFGSCRQSIVLNADINPDSGQVPVFFYAVGDDLLGYFFTSPSCADCRLAGGKNVKPSFW